MLWPQPSMRSYENGEWQLEMDPNLNKDRAWVRATPEWEWAWMLPPSRACSGESDSAIPEGVHDYRMPWAPNVQTSRFNFPWDDVCYAVRDFKPDAVILEVPEHAPGVRMVQEWLGVKFGLISYVNYAPLFRYAAREGVDTWERQMEGARASDMLVFNTRGLRDVWLMQAACAGHDLRGRATLWPGVYSPQEIEDAYSRKVSPPAVFFTSRLSDPGKNRGGQFFDALREVEGEFEFQTWIGDPNRSVDDEVAWKLAPNVTRLRCNSRRQYLRMMNEAAIVPTLWSQDMIYSIGYCDALAAGALSIVAAEGREPVAGIVVPPEPEVGDLAAALREAFAVWGDPLRRAVADEVQSEWLLDNRSVEKNAERMVKSVEHAARMHVH